MISTISIMTILILRSFCTSSDLSSIEKGKKKETRDSPTAVHGRLSSRHSRGTDDDPRRGINCSDRSAAKGGETEKDGNDTTSRDELTNVEPSRRTRAVFRPRRLRRPRRLPRLRRGSLPSPAEVRTAPARLAKLRARWAYERCEEVGVVSPSLIRSRVCIL